MYIMACGFPLIRARYDSGHASIHLQFLYFAIVSVSRPVCLHNNHCFRNSRCWFPSPAQIPSTRGSFPCNIRMHMCAISVSMHRDHHFPSPSPSVYCIHPFFSISLATPTFPPWFLTVSSFLYLFYFHPLSLMFFYIATIDAGQSGVRTSRIWSVITSIAILFMYNKFERYRSFNTVTRPLG